MTTHERAAGAGPAGQSWSCACGVRNPVRADECGDCGRRAWTCARWNTGTATGYREHSASPDATDVELARLDHEIRRSARHADDPQAELDWRLHRAFTADEVARINAYKSAGTRDTARLAAVEARLGDTTDTTDATGDAAWLVAQLHAAWDRIDALKDQIDNAGSLMLRDGVAAAIYYVPWSREDAGA